MKRRNPSTAMVGQRCERDRRWHILYKTLKLISFHNQHYGWRKFSGPSVLWVSGYFAPKKQSAASASLQMANPEPSPRHVHQYWTNS